MMADWTELPNTAVGVGGIPSGTTVTALRDNPIAIAERAAGAPKVVGTDYEILSRTVISGSPSVIDFTFDPTIFDTIHFTFQNVRPTSDNQSLLMRFSDDDGATFFDGASSYLTQRTQAQGTTVSTSEISNAHFILAASMGNAAAERGASGYVTVFGPNNASERTRIVGHSYSRNTSGGSSTYIASGERVASDLANAVRFLLSSGNFESGIITMYGVRNS